MLDEKFKTIKVTEWPDGSSVVASLVDRLEDYFVIENWSEEMHRFLNQYDGPRMIFDCTGIYIITSQAIATLLSLKYNAKERNIGFALCGLNEYNAKTFRITCLDRAFIVGETPEQAAENLRAVD